MESEKVKEIKKALECWQESVMLSTDENYVSHKVYNREILDYINELESDNERLSKEKEDLRLFDIALGNGKVDMTLGGNIAKSFINAIVQIFEQNNATNFLATTIETVSSGNKYSLVIQKENGQTPSEKLTELKDRIAELEKENKDYYDRLNNLQTYIDNHEEIWKGNTKKQLKRNFKNIEKFFKEKLKEKVNVNNVDYFVESIKILENTIKEMLKENE